MSLLDQRVMNYYQSRTLNSSRMQAILAQSRRSRRRRLYPAYAAAAALLMVFFSMLHQYSLTSQRISVALHEAAMNHATKLKLDAKADSLTDLQNSLEKLPFNLVLPKGQLYERLALLGGRYCTISGNLAAHLKLTDPQSGEQYSLFMTPFKASLKPFVSDPEQIAGVEVAMWQENNVIYATARSAPAQP